MDNIVTMVLLGFNGTQLKRWNQHKITLLYIHYASY